MTYAASTIPGFYTALQAQVQAAADAAEGAGVVPVCLGAPTPEQWDQPAWIMLGDLEGGGHIEVFSRTTQPRDEDYTIAVLVSVSHETRSDQASVDARAWVLADYVNQVLRTDPRLGVTGVKWAYDYVQAVNRKANDRVRECAIELGVQVRARI